MHDSLKKRVSYSNKEVDVNSDMMKSLNDDLEEMKAQKKEEKNLLTIP